MIIFNGQDLSDLIKVTEEERPILPPSLLTTSTISGRDGSFLHKKQNGSYSIPISFLIRGENRTSLRQKVRELAEVLDHDSVKPLIFKDEPDKYIDVILSGGTPMTEVAAVGKGDIEFFAPDPFWYAVEDDVIERLTTGVFEFERKGTADSYPLIIVDSTMENGTVTVESSDSKITYSGDLAEDEVLYLDSNLITAYIEKSNGERRSVIEDLDNLDFPVLKGGTNFLSITVSPGAQFNKANVFCKSRWK